MDASEKNTNCDPDPSRQRNGDDVPKNDIDNCAKHDETTDDSKTVAQDKDVAATVMGQESPKSPNIGEDEDDEEGDTEEEFFDASENFEEHPPGGEELCTECKQPRDKKNQCKCKLEVQYITTCNSCSENMNPEKPCPVCPSPNKSNISLPPNDQILERDDVKITENTTGSYTVLQKSQTHLEPATDLKDQNNSDEHSSQLPESATSSEMSSIGIQNPTTQCTDSSHSESTSVVAQRKVEMEEWNERTRLSTVKVRVIISGKLVLKHGEDSVYMCLKKKKIECCHKMKSTGLRNDSGYLYTTVIDTSSLCADLPWKYTYYFDHHGRREYEDRRENKKGQVTQFSRELNQKMLEDNQTLFDVVAQPLPNDYSLKKIITSPSLLWRKENVSSNNQERVCMKLLHLISNVIEDLSEQRTGTIQNTAEYYIRQIVRHVEEVPRFELSSDVGRFVQNNVLDPLIKFIQSSAATKSVTLATFILLVMNEYNLKVRSLSAIFKALLIKPDFQARTCPDLDDLNNHFPKIMNNKSDLLTMLHSNFKNLPKESPSWIYCVPLLHFLMNESVPFTDLPPSTSHRTREWWGTTYLTEQVERFKSANYHLEYEKFSEVFEELKPVFEVDPLMFRTFIATMNLRNVTKFFQSHDVPLHIVLASLFYHVNTAEPFSSFEYKDIGSSLQKAVKTTREEFRSTKPRTQQEVEVSKVTTVIAIELLGECVKKQTDNVIDPATQLVLILCDSLPQDYLQPKTKKIVMKLISYWLQNIPFNKMTETQILQIFKAVNEYLKICETSSTNFMKDIAAIFDAFVTARMNGFNEKQRLSMCLKLLENPATPSETFKKYIFFHLEDVLANLYLKGLTPDRMDQEQRSMCKYLSDTLETKWSSSITTEQKIEIVTKWRPLKVFLSWQGNSRFNSILTKEAVTHIEDASNFVRSLTERLMTANITVKEFQWILQNRDQFMEVVDVISRKKETCMALQLRQRELESFKKTAVGIVSQLEFCRKCVETRDADDIISKFKETTTDIEDRLLCELCEAPPNDVQVTSYRPKIKLKSVTSSFRDTNQLNSDTYRHFFHVQAQTHNYSREENWWDVLNDLFQVVNMNWNTLCESIQTGDITLDEVKQLFPFVEKDNRWIEKCEEEFTTMATPGNTGWIQERVQQMVCMNMLGIQQETAEKLHELKKVYRFSTDVYDIEAFLQLDVSQKLKDITPTMLKTSQNLSELNADEITHPLQLLTSEQCTLFFEWVRKTMGDDGRKEVKVFVDLALNSVGDNPIDIDKVRNLQTVINGFAPIIFQTSSASISFLECCRNICHSMKEDTKILEKLESSIKHLPWFDGIHQFHGSVEKTAMAQVENISSKGIMVMGNVLKERKSGKDLQLADVICLDVPGGDTANESSTFSYQDLMDLQSRLMLVVGHAERGDETVERFVTVMESIEHLAKVYIQLCQEGCLFFINWNVKFYFGELRDTCCITEFFLGKDSRKLLKGSRSQSKMEFYIAEMAHFLDDCRGTWQNYVSSQRDRYDELNTYTMDQLVFLQEQLVLLESPTLSPCVLPLLSLLQPNCKISHVKDAIEKAAAFSDANPEEGEDDAHFIRQMMTRGFPSNLAKIASKNVKDLRDFEEGERWCTEHLNDEEEEEDVNGEWRAGGNHENFSDGAVHQLLNRDDTFAGAMLREQWTEELVSSETLMEQLNDVWKMFLQTVKFSGEDCLSLKHLGLILRFLALQDDRQFKRNMFPHLKRGEPHLILCPRCEVLKTLTSIYMTTENTPLPQPDEVLLCTRETTLEQVDMFLRRAFSKTSCDKGKIHCMAFADHLDYDISEATEKRIKEYINTSKTAFQLIVICTTENEFSAHITAALERFLRQAPRSVDPERIISYLHTKFTVDKNKDPPVKTAASVDPESLCVRMVKSTRSGMGKSLYKRRIVAKLGELLGQGNIADSTENLPITIPLYGNSVDPRSIAACLLSHLLPTDVLVPRIIHLDISYEVLEGVDLLLYSLLVLGCITDHHGHVWLRSPIDLYLIEGMPLMEQTNVQKNSDCLVHQMFSLLPSLCCWSPLETLMILEGTFANQNVGKHDQLFDDLEFQSETFQLPVKHLRTFEREMSSLHSDPKEFCLRILMKYCGINNPSWSELHHFVSFLNKQLHDFEESVFCGMGNSDTLPGFSAFVLRFLILMSRDFATRSLVVAEETVSALQEKEDLPERDILGQFQMRRKWESSSHPYIFFNPDRNSMTFLGFSIDKKNFSLLDSQGNILETRIMTQRLYVSLVANGVPLSEDFDSLERHEILIRLYRVMGLTDDEMSVENGQEGNVKRTIIDPDPTYELTLDNVKKILAIYMRFRCDIPVVVMGETGCGKTRLVKFMCALQTPKDDVNSLVLTKVHGGTTSEDIQKKVFEAENLSEQIHKRYPSRPVYTVLFFDEANTTEAVGVIKEVMCDMSMNGKPIHLHQNLKMVAACNPYRKHSEEVITRLEKAGLGYHVSAEKTRDKLGRLPMRQLVYRVQPLPQSMLPLVWDFGQLTPEAESIYIKQMIKRYKQDHLYILSDVQTEVLCKILVESQKYMREQKDECSFVSLRDADRTLTVCSWFIQQTNLLKLVDAKLKKLVVDNITKSLVLALGVCYRAGLRSKLNYDSAIIRSFNPEAFRLSAGEDLFRNILDSCADVMLDNVELGPRIARNQALKENIFMMVVCVELRIPLFLVGKPGSSKSLAKSVVADAMQGPQSHGQLFKSLKEIHMLSFQCSPLATADGIQATFSQCAQIQHGKDTNNFTAVVVLDEVGLAEDSPKMPLKALHPLLEEGCEVKQNIKSRQKGIVDNQTSKPIFEKIAFIGISNWALDPAKMNRGILVQRDIPEIEELVQTAEGICDSGEKGVLELVKSLLRKLADAYLEIFNKTTEKREFFGLRDFYSMVKLVHAFASQKKRKLTRSEFRTAFLRNFGGLDTVDPVKVFEPKLQLSDCSDEAESDYSTTSLLLSAVRGDGMGGESRYLLLLTENYGGLRILTDHVLHNDKVVPIFGSSFPKDQEYTGICCNINHIKVCMETGQTVILLNLDNLYESLYDALNQYYSSLAGVRYVDLGLGTHRVKCKVDERFRLIVVAERQTVYEKFPIPLINRLEKHFLNVSNILTRDQLELEKQLHTWVIEVVMHCSGHNSVQETRPTAYANTTGTGQSVHLVEGDVFIGYHLDTPASVILVAWERILGKHGTTEGRSIEVLEESKKMLLWCATPDCIIRSRDWSLINTYCFEQQHEDLAQYLQVQLAQANERCLMIQVTTHSKILTENERLKLREMLTEYNFMLLNLHAFDTEQQFRQQLREFLRAEEQAKKVLLVQCENGNQNQTLLQCAQFCVQKNWPRDTVNRHVVFIVQLPRVASANFMGFQCGKWQCAHIDDLRTSDIPLPNIVQLMKSSPAQLLTDADMVPLELQVETDMNTEIQESYTSGRGLHIELVRHLLVTCTQEAMARIQGGDESGERSKHRIDILLSALENKDDISFFSGIKKLMEKLMKEEETLCVHTDWLASDAAKLQRIRQTGTFRRAWMQCLQQLMSPVFAGIVAFLDTNHNLNLLQPDVQSPWMQRIWMDIFLDQHLCKLKYSDFKSVTGKRFELASCACQVLFLSGDAVNSELPFSWIISEQIETSLVRTSDEDEGIIESAVHMIEHNLGDYFQVSISSQVHAIDFLKRYASDLLHTKFILNHGQHEILLQCFMNALHQAKVFEPLQLERALVQTHLILAEVRPRLLSVLDMIACHPPAIQELIDKLNDPQNPLYETKELVEDILLLTRLVDALKPNKTQLNTEDGCRDWLDIFNTVAPVIHRVLAYVNMICEQTTKTSESNDAEIKLKYFPFGQWCLQQLVSLRYKWTRAAAVKLFIDYMIPLLKDANKTQVNPKRVNYSLLWTLLGEKADLKRKETLENVDKFLKNANSQTVKSLFGDVGKCEHCKTKLWGPPVQLTCHRICDLCYDEEACVKGMCPECETPISQDFNRETSEFGQRDKVNQLLHYQKQTSAFLMALISQLCFAGHTPPHADAVQHIFSYIIRRAEGMSTIRTQQLTLRDDQMDPSPVLRSFILRLLLKHSESEVSQRIDSYLKEAKELIQQQKKEKDQEKSVQTELSLLVIYCIENLQHEIEATDENRNLGSSDIINQRQIHYITQLLHEIQSGSDNLSKELNMLIFLGRLRYVLDTLARILHFCLIKPSQPAIMDENLKNLCNMAANIFQAMSTDWPKKFFVKQLCREFGVEAYNILLHRLQDEECLQWIKLSDIQKVEEVPDRYLMCGEEFQNMRTEVTLIMRGHNHDQLKQRLDTMTCSVQKKEYLLMLALHREVTMTSLHASQAVQDELKGYSQALLQKMNFRHGNKIAKLVCENKFGKRGSPLRVNTNQSLSDQSLVCVIIHYWLATQAGENTNGIVRPLITIMNQPHIMTKSLLPTMPQDDFDMVLNVAEGDVKGTSIWKCPNGHRYLIGDCGRPWVRGQCHRCGASIGGIRHKEEAGNTRSCRTDRTQPGHILGSVEHRSAEAVPERSMSATACALLRFLTHASLFIAVNQSEKATAVMQIVRPQIQEENLVMFFWGHLLQDIVVLENALHRCSDDVYLLLHDLCCRLAETQTDDSTGLLESKQERDDWEKKFTETFLTNTIQSADVIIERGHNCILKDTKMKALDKQSLQEMILEDKEEANCVSSVEDLLMSATPWKYRRRINVDDFFNHFKQDVSEADKYPVLRLFHTESHHLRALYYLQDILENQHRIMLQLRHRLNRSDAAKITIVEMQKRLQSEALLSLRRVFSKAWDIVKESLVSYACYTEENNLIRLPQEFHNISVNDSSPVAMLFPATSGPGLCSYLLIHYLLIQHNNFMKSYCSLVKQSYEQLPEIAIHDITKHHLVCYSPQADLLPLVLAHCNYSLHLGKTDPSTTQIEYDFQGFELQLKNTLLLGKSKVQQNHNGSLKIEMIIYGADTTTSKLFSRLRNKIKQTSLSLRERREIVTDLRDSLPDICQSVDNLNVALHFLLTLRVDQEQCLQTFMRETLKMTDTIHSRKAQQLCYLKHVQSLWLLLCMQRAVVLTTHNQEAFDDQGNNLRKVIDDETKSELENALKHLTPECLEVLLWQIFECIMLLLIQQNDEDSANPDNYSINWLVSNNLEYPLYEEDTEEKTKQLLTTEDLDRFPEALRASHSISVWIAVLTHLNMRRQQLV